MRLRRVFDVTRVSSKGYCVMGLWGYGVMALWVMDTASPRQSHSGVLKWGHLTTLKSISDNVLLQI